MPRDIGRCQVNSRAIVLATAASAASIAIGGTSVMTIDVLLEDRNRGEPAIRPKSDSLEADKAMEYRKFGATDITVSAIGFGCHDASKPTKGLWGDEYIDRMCATVNRAIDAGINCFDTAPHYGLGDSEKMLGRALGARRKDVVLVTKCGLGWQGSEVDRPKPGRDSRRDYILPLVEQSLERMQTDYIDVLLVHYPDPHTPFEETMDTLDSTRAAGEGAVRGPLESQPGPNQGMQRHPEGGCGAVPLQRDRQASGPGAHTVLRGRGHRRDGLGGIGIRPPVRDLHGR